MDDDDMFGALEDAGIVHLKDGGGRARKPIIPYDRIEIDVGIEASVTDDFDRASHQGEIT